MGFREFLGLRDSFSLSFDGLIKQILFEVCEAKLVMRLCEFTIALVYGGEQGFYRAVVVALKVERAAQVAVSVRKNFVLLYGKSVFADGFARPA